MRISVSDALKVFQFWKILAKHVSRKLKYTGTEINNTKWKTNNYIFLRRKSSTSMQSFAENLSNTLSCTVRNFINKSSLKTVSITVKKRAQFYGSLVRFTLVDKIFLSVVSCLLVLLLLFANTILAGFSFPYWCRLQMYFCGFWHFLLEAVYEKPNKASRLGLQKNKKGRSSVKILFKWREHRCVEEDLRFVILEEFK